MKLYKHITLLVLSWQKCKAFNNNNGIKLSSLAYNQRQRLLGQQETLIRQTHLIQRASTLPMKQLTPSPSSLSSLLLSPYKSILNILQSMNEVQKWQAAAIAFLSSICVFQPKIDIMLQSSWNTLLHSQGLLPTMFRHDQ